MLRTSLFRLALAASAPFALSAAAGCTADTGSDVGYATDAESCALAQIDTHGYCRAPNGQFAERLCCEQNASGDVEGFIDEIFIGEMDPFVVGDVCVFWVKSYDGDDVTGVIEDSCEEAGYLADVDATGWSILFSSDGLEAVTAEEDEVLQDYRTATKYYRFYGEVVIPENNY